MPNERRIDLEAIRRTPVRKLLELSNEQLDRYIEKAERTSVDAAIVLNWLESIKREKKISEIGKAEGGQND